MRVLHYVDTNHLAWMAPWIQLLKELETRGVENYVLCRKDRTLSPALEKAGIQHEEYNPPAQWIPPAALGLGKIIDRLKPDLIHTRLSAAAALGGYWGRKKGVPVLSTFDKYPKAKYYKNSDALIGCSSAVTTFIKGLNLSHAFTVETILNPVMAEHYLRDESVRTEFRRKMNVGNETVVLGMGRFVAWKAWDDYLRAIALVSPETNARFWLVGGGEESGKTEKSLRDLAKELGIEKRVEFFPFASDVRPWLWASDVSVQTSKEPEGFSLMLLEAMAAGLMPIATNIGGTLDIVRDGKNGLLIKPGDPPALAAGIERANDAALREEMARNAVLSAAEVNVSRIADETLVLYRKTLEHFDRTKSVYSITLLGHQEIPQSLGNFAADKVTSDNKYDQKNEDESIKRPCVSVIIPVYNSAKRLKFTVESLRKQEYPELEIIFCDDASTDGSLEYLEGLARDHVFRNLQILRNDKNMGVSFSRNRGFAAARGEYAIFVDADDMMEPNFISSLYAALIHSGADYVACGHKKLDIKTGVAEKIPLRLSADASPEEVLCGRILNNKIELEHWTVFYRKKFLTENNLTYTVGCSVGEDNEFLIKMLCCMGRGTFIDDCLYVYVLHDGMGSRKNIAYREKRIARYIANSEAQMRSADLVAGLKTSKKAQDLAQSFMLPIGYQRRLACCAIQGDRKKFDDLRADPKIRQVLKNSRKSFFLKPEVFLRSCFCLYLPNIYYRHYLAYPDK